MTFLPRHPVSRVVAALWLLASVAILVWLLLQPGIETDDRYALATLVPLYFLSFPIGHAGFLAWTEIRLELYLNDGTMLSILAEGLMLWTFLTVLGYAQWFLLLPWLCRKCRQLFDFLLNRDLAKSRTAR